MTDTPTARERREFETHWRMNPVTRQILDDAIDAAITVRGGAPIEQVLDVGCGRQSNVVFPGAARVVGTDLDVRGLDGNVTVDVAVAADIVTAEIPEQSVDAVACIYVLEHVAHPDRVFGKLARALRPGGVMIIAVPNVAAPKAQVTKYTPLSFHNFVYERLLGRKEEGTAHLPFATVLDSSLRPDRIENLAAICGLDVVTRTDFEDNKQRELRKKVKLGGAPWRALRSVFRGLTRGRVDPELSDVVFTFHRPQPTPTGDLADALLAE